jgi:hypothetical protein
MMESGEKGLLSEAAHLGEMSPSAISGLEHHTRNFGIYIRALQLYLRLNRSILKDLCPNITSTHHSRITNRQGSCWKPRVGSPLEVRIIGVDDGAFRKNRGYIRDTRQLTHISFL